MNKADNFIRRATPDDTENLIDLWLELMAHHKGQSPVFNVNPDNREGIKEILERHLTNSNVRLLVSEVDSKIVGFIISRFQQGSEVFELNKKGYIAETVVTKKYRGQKIGDQLYKEAEEWLLSEGVDHIQLQVSVLNKGAQSFWESKGFKPTTFVMNKEI